MLKNSVSQEPLEPLADNKSRASPDASGRPPDIVKQPGSLETPPHGPSSPGLAVIQFLKASSPQDSTVLGNCQVLER